MEVKAPTWDAASALLRVHQNLPPACDMYRLRRPKRAQNRKRNHPRPREMDTSRIEVKAPTWDAEIMPIQVLRLLEDDDVILVRRDVRRDVVQV